MWSKITQNVKRTWNKTVQEFHEFEAQQDAKRQDKRHAEQSRLRRQARLQGLLVHSTLTSTSTDACENGANITQKTSAIGSDKEIDADERKKRRKKVDKFEPTANPVGQFHHPLLRSTTHSVSRKVNLSEDLQEYEHKEPGIESHESTGELSSSPYSPHPARQPLSSARSAGVLSRMHSAPNGDKDSAAAERWLRKKVVHLERELQESRDLVQRLHEQLGEQDDYIRAMEFEKSRVEENRVDGRSNELAHVTNHTGARKRRTEKPSLSRRSSKADFVEVADDKLFEQMSPVPLADLISRAAE
ncbi:hypothetical protein V1525DRAFT_423245 [Lipomyces kononenkoae]|uniref:Uncharacterized protein n=1 Tax=Lipomyces kononenkoae TaxID=34357 RepID=A0ACC3TAN1_LIPKO